MREQELEPKQFLSALLHTQNEYSEFELQLYSTIYTVEIQILGTHSNSGYSFYGIQRYIPLKFKFKVLILGI